MDKDYTGTKVLFVDDEPNVLESHKRVLRPYFDITTALGGEAALDAMENSGPFVVIVSDIKMPRMDGIELLSRVRAKFPETIRMVLTGYADLEIAVNAVNQGDIFRFLSKPATPQELVAAVKAGVDQYELLQAAHELEVVRRIKNGLEGTLRSFTRLVEFRDPYTAGHMDRTAEIASLIAEQRGLEKERIQGLRFAGLVHDIGKIAVPSGILNKPGSLSSAEFSIIKTHPLVGAEIFMTLETDWEISRMVQEHHERIDGSGYPYGLFEKSLLLESRILAVADTIDAILTNRPYRMNLGIDEAIRILEKTKGRSLDGPSVEIGIDLIRQGMVVGDTRK